MTRMLLIAAGAAVVCPASAEVFFGTYTPSQNDVTIASSTDPWIYEIRDHDAAAMATTQSDSFAAYRSLNVFGTAISRQSLYNEFVAPATFSASHISVAVSRTGGATDTLLALSVQKWDEAGGVWENLYGNFGGARVRAAGVPNNGEIMDMILPFGNNQTGGPGGFSSTPATIEAGERYRVIFSHSAGAVGGLNWHLSTQASQMDAIGLDGDAMTGPSESAYYEGFNANDFTSYAGEAGFQFSFAFTDGDPVPAPATLALSGAGLLAASRRRR